MQCYSRSVRGEEGPLYHHGQEVLADHLPAQERLELPVPRGSRKEGLGPWKGLVSLPLPI